MASATTTMIDIKLIDGWYVVTAPKCTLVLTKAQFIEALRRGRWWRRRQALRARLAPVTNRDDEADRPQQPAIWGSDA
jgi:hypothetical protein